MPPIPFLWGYPDIRLLELYDMHECRRRRRRRRKQCSGGDRFKRFYECHSNAVVRFFCVLLCVGAACFAVGAPRQRAASEWVNSARPQAAPYPQQDTLRKKAPCTRAPAAATNNVLHPELKYHAPAAKRSAFFARSPNSTPTTKSSALTLSLSS